MVCVCMIVFIAGNHDPTEQAWLRKVQLCRCLERETCEAAVVPVNDDTDSPLCRRRDEIHRVASIFTLNI